MRRFICAFLFALNIHAEVIPVQKSSDLTNVPSELYIDLMKRCLTNVIYEDPSYSATAADSKFSYERRRVGRDWPMAAHTMVGLVRLDNIHYCMKEIIENNIPGDCIETGVWRGGSTILMRAILKAYGETERKVWVADSFQGLPPPNVEKYPADLGLDLYKYSELAVPIDVVMENFEKYGLLDQQVVFLKGWFSETLPNAPIQQLALLRLDGDLYESTMDSLVNLYPKLSVGGFVIIDDYMIPACKAAVDEFRQKNNIQSHLIQIDMDSVYWKKNEF